MIQEWKRFHVSPLGPWSQCGNFSIFLLLRFYVKLIMKIEGSNSSKTAIFAIWEALNSVMANFSPQTLQKIIKIEIQTLKIVKIAIFQLVQIKKFISRRIWMAEIFWDFQTVVYVNFAYFSWFWVKTLHFFC